MIITFTNVIGAIRNAISSVITTNLKMWLGFETSETLGREEVVNGDFSDGTNNWTTSNSTISIEDGALKITSTGGNRPQANQTVSGLVVGSQYKLSAVAKRGTTANDVEIEISGIASPTTSNRNTTTEYETIFYIFTATFTSHIIQAKIDEASEPSGTTAYFSNISLKELIQYTPDKSGNNNVGELFTGKALEFDGTNDYVSANSFAGTLSNNTAFTFAIWFNSDKPTDERNFGNILISSGGTNQATNIFKIGVNPRTTPDTGNNKNPGGIYFDDSYGYNNQVPSSGGVFYNDGEWHRLVVSRPQGSGVQDLSFYVDGSYIGKADCNPYWNNMTKFDFGQEWDPSGTSDHFEGKMSDIQVYDYAWDADDVIYDYANPNKLAIDNPNTDLVVTNLKGYWAMSEGAGSLAYDSGTNLEEELVDNGDFSNGTTVGWSFDNLTADISNNTLKLTSTTPAYNRAYYNISTEVGKTYQMSVDVKSGATNSESEIGGIGVTNPYNVKDGANAASFTTLKITFIATLTTTQIRLLNAKVDTWGGLGSIVEFDNVSVREVTASDHGGLINGADYVLNQPRIPQLGMMNWSKGSNLLTYSNDFTQWLNPSSIAITPNYGTSPIGTQDASRVVFTGSNQQIKLSFTSTTNLTASIYMKGSGTIKFGMNTEEQVKTLSTNWQRFIVSEITGGSNVTFNTYGGTTARDIQVWGAQVEVGTSAGNYRLTDGVETSISTVIANPTIPTKDIFGNLVQDRLNSFNLDGSGYAEVADNADLDFGTGDFTLECWLRIDGNTLRRLLDKRTNTSGYTLYLTDLNVLNLELNDGAGNSEFILTSSLSSNTWLHLAIVCDRSANATCYVNKAAQTPVNISSKGGNIDSTSSLFIGADAPDGLQYYSTDIISDVRLYDRALTSDEVENNYNAGLSAHTN